MTNEVSVAATEAERGGPGADEIEGDGWTILEGKVSTEKVVDGIRSDGIEPLSFNNPFAQGMERVWFDGKIVFALDAGELDMPEAGDVKVAKEYQCVYSVELDKQGKLVDKEEVPAQLNIYDSVPGMDDYSPIWQFYYVVVPRDYSANTLRSISACDRSGFPIHRSNVFEN